MVETREADRESLPTVMPQSSPR